MVKVAENRVLKENNYIVWLRNQMKKNDDRMRNVYNIIEQTIATADPALINQLYSVYEKDLEKFFNDVTEEVYRILYGTEQLKSNPSIEYIKEYDSVLEEEMRCASLGFFCSNVMKMDMNWHHLEWAWLAENFGRIAILASRDHGKSYFWSNAYPAWRAYMYDPNHSNPYRNFLCKRGRLFSNTMPQATEHLEILKDNVADIDILREKLKPETRDFDWSKTSIQFKNGVRLKIGGYDSASRGGHPSWILVDDALKDNVLYSPTVRERSKDTFKSVITPMCIPKGQIVVVGTPFHAEDLYSIFRNSTDYAYREYPAIDNKGRILWKGRYDEELLAERKRIQGSIIFTREYLCKPVSDQSSLFPRTLLERALLGMQDYSFINNIKESKIKFKKVVTGCDFAKSANVGADYTVFITLGLDEYGNVWILNMYRKLGAGFKEQKQALRRIWREFKPDIMLLEANQFQSIYTETMKDESDMPVKPFITDTRKHSLQDGVPSLVVLFENAKVRIPYKSDPDKIMAEEIMNEFNHISWTDKGIQGVGAHDDIPMAFWLARMAMIFGDSADDLIVDFAEEEDTSEFHNEQTVDYILGEYQNTLSV